MRFKSEEPKAIAVRTRWAHLIRTAAWAGLGMVTIGSAITVKELQSLLTHPMAALQPGDAARAAESLAAADDTNLLLASDDALAQASDAAFDAEMDADAADPAGDSVATDDDAPSPTDDALAELARDPNVRWFNGRPVRPARTITMTVTAYSPDHRSCGDSADGITATLHPVTTNGHALVAADPRVLRYGSMITVPGYDQNRIVPVLDCGGAIKGRRLDVLFPTHEQAIKWGVRRLQVVVWEYADGKPAENPRKVR